MANITPKGNGTYPIHISCGSDASGKPITKSKIFKPSKPKLFYQKLNKEGKLERRRILILWKSGRYSGKSES